MVESREIPQSEWWGLCDQLKKSHNRSLVSVTVDSPRSHRELVRRPLAELSARAAAQGESILIAVGNQWDGYLGHTVSDPTRVRVLGPSEEGTETLVVEAADGSITVVDFYPAD